MYTPSIDVYLNNLILLSFKESRGMEEFCVVIFYIEAVCSSPLSPNSFPSDKTLVKKVVCCFQSGILHIIQHPVITFVFKIMYNGFKF